MFEKTLTDVVKGIRASKRDTALYISQCIAEIKTEINSSDMFVKANALQKLTFLQMMGYSMSWASFATIEVMSSPRFAHKRVGYLAASQGFTQDTDVILLTTNLLKKELKSSVGGSMSGVYEAGLAVNCISNIVTHDLAQDLLPELTSLTSHPQPYLRKKAVLCLFKVFVKYPQGLRLTFAQIQERLGDSNSSVVSCAVNVITELADKNPKNYLHLAPAFFDLLTTSSNNWMLIKVVKLFGSLVPEEPRLARKLLEPLANIVRNTPAKSLLFEAVHAITLCLPYCRKQDGSMPASVPEIVTLCADTLRDFVEEPDQNLKYLGLVGFGSLRQSHPKILSAPSYRPLILQCLSDEDVTIRSRALDLLPGMANRKNLKDLVSQLIPHIESATGRYKEDLALRIVEMCSSEKYSLLADFPWYLDTLLTLGHTRGLEAHAELLKSQITDVALRVLPARPHAVRCAMETILEGETSFVTSNKTNEADNGRGRHIMREILPSLAWIVGEYSDLIPDAINDSNSVFIYNNDSEGPYHSILQALSDPANFTGLPPEAQAIYLQASMKIFAAATANNQVADDELEACARILCLHLPVFERSVHVEVMERATTALNVLRVAGIAPSEGDSIPGLLRVDESSDSDDEAKAGSASAEGNLLNILGTMSSPPAQSVQPPISPATRALATKCRDESLALNALFKPSPMKPVGSKPLKKKYSNPIGLDGIDMNGRANLDVFGPLLDAERAAWGDGRPTLESISFTGRIVHKPASNIAMDHVASFHTSSSFTPMSPTEGPLSGRNDASLPRSFQNLPSPGNASAPQPTNRLNAPTSASDPFYLASGPPMLDNEVNENSEKMPSKFGAIQLGDGGDSDNDVTNEGKRKKKKKKKDRKQAETKQLFSPGLMGNAKAVPSSGTVAIYSSDDEDEEEVRVPPAFRQGANRGAPKGNKEFSGLAQVDLTMPLREDEVMPERKHRVVPERSPQESADVPKKKESRKKKKKYKKKEEAASGGVGDLLDLGMFQPSAEPAQAADTFSTAPAPTVPSAFGASSSNPINNAFDDLLGLTTPAPAPTLGLAGSLDATTPTFSPAVAEPTNAPTKDAKSTKRPWLRVSLKASQASGSDKVDWSKVACYYRVYRSSSTGEPSVSVVFRVDNGLDSSLDGLEMQLKGNSSIALGSVGPLGSVESSKVGPFQSGTPDAALELKGALTALNSAVPCKLSIPATIYLSPVENLALEDVARELSIASWSSHSVKLPVENSERMEKVKPLVANFLRAAEVEPGSSGPVNGTFAAVSSRGVQIRVLIKVKQDSVKVDIKSMDDNLGKSLISDVKRLVI